MTDSFDEAWVSVEKAAFGRGRERRRQEAYARAPEMMRRFKAMRDMQQGVNPNRPTTRRRPTRRSASSAPPATRTRRKPTRTSPTPTETEGETRRTTTLTPRLPTLIPAVQEDEIDEWSSGRGGYTPEVFDAIIDQMNQQEGVMDPPYASYEEMGNALPHVDITYKTGDVIQIALEDFSWEAMTDIRDVETIYQSDENGETKLIFEAPKDKEIEQPASEVIDPSEEVVGAVNQMKPLQSDMQGLPKKPNKNFANVFKPLMAESIAEAIGPAENRDKVVAAMQRKKAKPTASEQPKPPSDAEDKKATEARLSQAMSSEMKPVEGKPDPVAAAAAEKFSKKKKQPVKGGMKMSDLIKPTEEKKIKEVPRLGSRPDREDVLQVMDLVTLGNKEAYTQLYGALGDLEDMGSDLYGEALEAIDEYKAMEKHRRKERRNTESTKRKEAKEKNLSEPLTEATDQKKLTSDDLAARLLNRGKKD